MANILKLNEISEVADKFLPAGYVFGKDVKNPTASCCAVSICTNTL